MCQAAGPNPVSRHEISRSTISLNEWIRGCGTCATLTWNNPGIVLFCLSIRVRSGSVEEK